MDAVHSAYTTTIVRQANGVASARMAQVEALMGLYYALAARWAALKTEKPAKQAPPTVSMKRGPKRPVATTRRSIEVMGEALKGWRAA